MLQLFSLVTAGHPALKQIAQPVPEGGRVDNLVEQMFMIMKQHKGIGLAANQVGVLQRVIVININGIKQEFINPVITAQKGGRRTSREGCLSYPGRIVSVARYKEITIEGFDKNWQPVKRKLKDLAASCVQHEMDHLDGRTIG